MLGSSFCSAGHGFNIDDPQGWEALVSFELTCQLTAPVVSRVSVQVESPLQQDAPQHDNTSRRSCAQMIMRMNIHHTGLDTNE
jgi:hypothetical protein